MMMMTMMVMVTVNTVKAMMMVVMRRVMMMVMAMMRMRKAMMMVVFTRMLLLVTASADDRRSTTLAGMLTLRQPKPGPGPLFALSFLFRLVFSLTWPPTHTHLKLRLPSKTQQNNAAWDKSLFVYSSWSYVSETHLAQRPRELKLTSACKGPLSFGFSLPSFIAIGTRCMSRGD